MNHIVGWFLGLFIVFSVVRVIRLQITGFFVVLFFTVLPYVVGRFILEKAGLW